ncbi:MAG: AAA family ATPase [Myxococcales bacterium]|nr:AAA family ATPase [Myxococcales bacterium]
MRLDKLTLDDIGPFRHLDLAFPRGQDDTRADVHLLVGPNGSGKSTILEALSQLFTAGHPGFAGRCRSPYATAAVEARGETLAWSLARPKSRHLDWNGIRLANAMNDGFPSHFGRVPGMVLHLTNRPWDELLAKKARFQNQHTLVFAYGSGRRLNTSHLAGVVNLTANPLAEAASFEKPESAGAFFQWILNVVAGRAIAAQQGRDDKARQLGGSLARVKEALRAVTGEQTVEFELNDELTGVIVVLGAQRVPHAQLPAGLVGLLSWVGDLIMRVDRLPWEGDAPFDEREFILLLDEVEVHLHPAWQRRVLPMIERLFPRAQVIAATHSPFIIQSASDAWVHRLAVEDGWSDASPPIRGPIGESYSAITQDILGVDSEFSLAVEADWTTLRALKERVLAGQAPKADFDALAKQLATRGEEIHRLVAVEVRQTERQLALQRHVP